MAIDYNDPNAQEDDDALDRQALLSQMNRKPPTLDGVPRRGGGTGGVAGGAVSGAMSGASAGSVLPGIGTALGAVGGALVGGIRGAFTRQAATAPTDVSVDDARRLVSDAYQAYEGREASAEDIDTVIRGQGWKPGDRWVGQDGLSSVLSNIQTNAEKARAAAPPEEGVQQVDGAPFAEVAEPGVGSPAAAGFGKAPAGFDQAKWDKPDSDSAKYIVSRSLAPLLDQVRAMPNEADRKAFIQAHLQTLVPQLEKAGWRVLDVKGEKVRIEGHGVPAHWADAVVDVEGAATSGWSTDLPEDAAANPVAVGATSADDSGMPSLAPTDMSTYQALLKRLQEILGPDAFDKQALIEGLGR